MTEQERKKIEVKPPPSEVEIKEFWEWCGCSLKHEWDNEIYGYETNGCFCTRCGAVEDYTPNKEPCLLSIDLNNLFKYAVPKLQNKGEVVSLVANEHSGFTCLISYFLADDYHTKTDNQDPALALFWAIWAGQEV